MRFSTLTFEVFRDLLQTKAWSFGFHQRRDDVGLNPPIIGDTQVCLIMLSEIMFSGIATITDVAIVPSPTYGGWPMFYSSIGQPLKVCVHPGIDI